MSHFSELGIVLFESGLALAILSYAKELQLFEAKDFALLLLGANLQDSLFEFGPILHALTLLLAHFMKESNLSFDGFEEITQV